MPDHKNLEVTKLIDDYNDKYEDGKFGLIYHILNGLNLEDRHLKEAARDLKVSRGQLKKTYRFIWNFLQMSKDNDIPDDRDQWPEERLKEVYHKIMNCGSWDFVYDVLIERELGSYFLEGALKELKERRQEYKDGLKLIDALKKFPESEREAVLWQDEWRPNAIDDATVGETRDETGASEGLAREGEGE